MSTTNLPSSAATLPTSTTKNLRFRAPIASDSCQTMRTTTTFGPDREYQAFLAQKRFMIQRARATGAHFYYPRIAEPRSGALEWEWVEASGLGTVYSTTVVRSKSGNHNVALIDLAEGPRMMSRVVGLSPESVVIGMQVRGFMMCSSSTATGVARI